MKNIIDRHPGHLNVWGFRDNRANEETTLISLFYKGRSLESYEALGLDTCIHVPYHMTDAAIARAAARLARNAHQYFGQPVAIRIG